MTINTSPAIQAQRAVAAIAAGDGAGARAILEPIALTNMGHPQIWMMLAEARRIDGDQAAFEAAADRVIAIEPRAVRAYGWKADCRLAQDDPRGAAAWYKEGITCADKFAPVPDALAEEVARQKAALAALEAVFARKLDDGLSAVGFAPDQQTQRFRESLAILNGDAEIQLQKPTSYYFPGLPQQAFYEREAFAWTAAVESAADDIRDELSAALAEDGLFTPYLEHDPTRPYRDFYGMTGNSDWSSLRIVDNGRVSPINQQRFARTLAALDAAPLCRIGVRAPAVMFSLLKAGARIPPHHGMINTRLICHLPIIVPGDGALRVGNQTRAWEPGRLLIFDDTIEHEAWNDADSDRIVLIFDVWRPELTIDEQGAVVALFGVIDADASA